MFAYTGSQFILKEVDDMTYSSSVKATSKEVEMVECSFCHKDWTPAKESKIVSDKGTEYFMCSKCLYKTFGDDVYNFEKRQWADTI